MSYEEEEKKPWESAQQMCQTQKRNALPIVCEDGHRGSGKSKGVLLHRSAVSGDGCEDSRKGGGEGEGQLARNDPRLTITKPEFQFQELLKLSMGLAQAQDNSSPEP